MSADTPHIEPDAFIAAAIDFSDAGSERFRPGYDQYRDLALAAEEAVKQKAALLEALETFVAEYVRLVESGDAGFWDAETEPKVIAARAAIAKARGGAA